MSGLADLDLGIAYRHGDDDIAGSFYLPCMERANSYSRAVGYFRSSVFVLAWPALRGFVEREGRMKLLCSQVLSSGDIDALREGYAARESEIGAQMRDEILAMLEDDSLRKPTRILAALVADGIIDLKVALLKEDDPDQGGRRGVFHDKLGIFEDSFSNAVVFKGSMNETWTGLSGDGNLESVDVYCSWRDGDKKRVELEETSFERMWADRYPSVNVVEFPEVAAEELRHAALDDWEGAVRDMVRASGSPSGGGISFDGSPHLPTLREHQEAGLLSWRENDRRGIMAFVTGGGKTFTAITAIREALSVHGDSVVVVVPDKVLFGQWEDELSRSLADLDPHIVKAGAGHSRWREMLGPATRESESPSLVLATIQTASKKEFLARLRGGDHLMLVVDEVHRSGAPERRALLDDQKFGARLGLSATPERAGDPEGTEVLLTFFGGVLEPRYSLADAVRDGVLAPYSYKPVVTYLSDDEMNDWKSLTAEIRQLAARTNGDPDGRFRELMSRKLIARARIVKGAASKVPLAVSILRREYEAGQRWLVYCDDQKQMNEVVVGLADEGIHAVAFHSEMSGDRDATLDWLSVKGGIVVAIKCLDEGVDIPAVSHALVLASSKNPREFIQRRGRVLRASKGKVEATIHDVIVLAPNDDSSIDDDNPDPVLVGELGRALEFARSAANPTAESDLHSIVVDAGIDWESVAADGTEDAEEDDAEEH